MNDWILGLLVAEGIPLLALVYYLEHRRRMYLLEKGCMIVESPERRAERRLCNGLFLLLTGAFVLSVPALAKIFGIEVRATLEQVLAGFLIASAGLALIIGTILIIRMPLKRPGNYESHSVPEAGRGALWK
ncbi:MAG: hypothetical protein H5T42_07795 [Methanothrix sp.]|uniref:Uncharacterized protein n=1 Tax=Methanothrix thermoacetophila (strain DSM 6194 / JCM 14653 / NBRC 101360 / PT) TaxID=349307 RepID=A0B7Z2_METTP|nr:MULTISPECIES: hypothetical protein [Methanothrix]ABK14816.1 hypothetical protein Mthe_1032 [Methanothrix thermoacetophila PT]MBC7080352.1 hypothetical protein [Methanothrix sp.]